MPDLEGRLNRELTIALRTVMPGAVVFKIADRATSGVPDISLNWQQQHVWIETKRASALFQSKGVQELTMRRLAAQGQAWYVIYDAGLPKHAYICPPSITIDDHWVKNKVWRTTFAQRIDNWNHLDVAHFFRDLFSDD
jgi:hypothetical protein